MFKTVARIVILRYNGIIASPQDKGVEMSKGTDKKATEKDILEDVKNNFDDYCDIADDRKKKELATVYNDLSMKLIWMPIYGKLATKGGPYSLDALLSRACMENVRAVRNPREWIADHIKAKHTDNLAQYQGNLYNLFADKVALHPLMIDDKRFDNCREKNGYILNNEIKSSEKTTNDGSFNSALRKLRRNEDELAKHTDKPVVSAYCILNSKVDSITIETCTGKGQDGKDNENADLRGFRYLKICGYYAWLWLYGIEGPYEIMPMNMDEFAYDLKEQFLAERTNECVEAYEKRCKKFKLDPNDKASILKLCHKH